MINFYRRFLPRTAEVLRPLTDALVGKLRALVWSEAMEKAFRLAKSQLTKATMLSHPVKDADLELYTDASSRAIAAAIHQVVNGNRQPLAFFNRRTTGPESRYSTYDLELQAIYSAILHFRHILEGRRFKIFTDQRPLTSAFFKVRDPVSNRQRNQLSFISKFCTYLALFLGLDNVITDTLSRQFDDKPAVMHKIAHHLADVDLQQLAADQQADPACQAADQETLLQAQPVPFSGVCIPLHCDVSLQGLKILVTESWRRHIQGGPWARSPLRQGHACHSFAQLLAARYPETSVELGSGMQGLRPWQGGQTHHTRDKEHSATSRKV